MLETCLTKAKPKLGVVVGFDRRVKNGKLQDSRRRNTVSVIGTALWRPYSQ